MAVAANQLRDSGAGGRDRQRRLGASFTETCREMADDAMTIDVDASEVSGAAEAVDDAQHETAEQTLV